MLTLKNLSSLLSILVATLLLVIGINPAMAQEAAPLPTVILVGDVDNSIADDVYVAAWPLTEPSILCPISVPVTEARQNFTVVKDMDIPLTRTAEQLNWVLGTYRIDGDEYTLLTGEDWTSCMSFSFMDDGTGDNQLYDPAEWLTLEGQDTAAAEQAALEAAMPKISAIGILPPDLSQLGDGAVIHGSHYRVIWWEGDAGMICPELPTFTELENAPQFDLSQVTGDDAEADMKLVTVNQGQHTIGTYVLNADGTLHLQQNSCLQTYVTADRTLYRPVITELPTAAVVTEKSPLVRKPDWRHFMAGLTPQTISLDGTKGGDTLGNFPAMDLTFAWAIAWERPEGTSGFELQLVRSYFGGGFYSYLETSYVMPRVSLGQFYGPYVNLPKQWRFNTLLGWQVGRSPVMVACSLVQNYSMSCSPANGNGEFEASVGSPFLAPAGSFGFQHTGSDKKGKKLTLGFELTALYEVHVMDLVIGRMTVISPEGEQEQLLPSFAPGLYGQLLLLPAVTVSW